MRRRWSARAEALSKLVDGGTPHEEHIGEIHRLEHQADDIIREVLRTVRQTFLTPFDRGAITSLIGAMDDAIDEMQDTARAIDALRARELQARDEADGGDDRRGRRADRRGDAAAARHQRATARRSTS